jgi:hypothetical protein
MDVWSDSRPSRFTNGEIAPGTHWIGGWVGPRAGLDAGEKCCTAGNRTRAVHPVTRRYTYSAQLVEWLELLYYIIVEHFCTPLSRTQQPRGYRQTVTLMSYFGTYGNWCISQELL